MQAKLGGMKGAVVPGIGLLLTLWWTTPALAADCEFVLDGEWNSGFTAAVQITNPGSTPIEGWEVQLTFPDGAAITHAWNTHLSGTNPYTATNQSYNATVGPNQTIQFGFNGAKADRGVPVQPPVLGGICNEAAGANTRPVARIVASPSGGAVPLAVQFDGRSATDVDGDSLTYRWDFGDGTFSTAAAPSKTFEAAGDYTVTLVVSDGTLESEPATQIITTNDPMSGDAECEFRVDSEWQSGFSAAVEITNPTERTIDGWIVLLDFPAGTTISGAYNARLSGSGPYQAANAHYNESIAPGQSVRFGFNANKPQSRTPAEIPVLGGICEAGSGGAPNRPPIARAEASPMEGDAPLTVRFDASASSDADGDALVYRWVFDDGNQSSDAVISKTFSSAGTYQATLTVNDGIVDSAPVNVVVTVHEPEPGDAYALDPTRSSLHFVSTKKRHVVESHSFGRLAGAISAQGLASLTIDLDSVATGIDIRDERMREYLFETVDFPEARVTLDITHLDVGALEIGRTAEHEVAATLDLHGLSVPFVAQLRVTRLRADTLLVQNIDPILIHAEDFALASGIEILRELAGLNVISYAVPVNFTLVYTAQ